MGDSRSITGHRTYHVPPHKMGGIGQLMSLGIGQSMSHPGSTHKNNLPGSENKSLTSRGESLDLKRGASHNL
jgi:hypothetical protein